jgi:hypothetical protein
VVPIGRAGPAPRGAAGRLRGASQATLREALHGKVKRQHHFLLRPLLRCLRAGAAKPNTDALLNDGALELGEYPTWCPCGGEGDNLSTLAKEEGLPTTSSAQRRDGSDNRTILQGTRIIEFVQSEPYSAWRSPSCEAAFWKYRV